MLAGLICQSQKCVSFMVVIIVIGGAANQAANAYKGKCSCMCNDYGNDAYNFRSGSASSFKSHGTIVP